MKKLEDLKKEYQSFLDRQLEIVREINTYSTQMSKEQIQDLEQERKMCVSKRKEIQKKISAVVGVVNKLRGMSGSSLEALRNILAEESNE